MRYLMDVVLYTRNWICLNRTCTEPKSYGPRQTLIVCSHNIFSRSTWRPSWEQTKLCKIHSHDFHIIRHVFWAHKFWPQCTKRSVVSTILHIIYRSFFHTFWDQVKPYKRFRKKNNNHFVVLSLKLQVRLGSTVSHRVIVATFMLPQTFH